MRLAAAGGGGCKPKESEAAPGGEGDGGAGARGGLGVRGRGRRGGGCGPGRGAGRDSRDGRRVPRFGCGSLGHGGEEAAQGLLDVEGSGGEDADGAAGGGEAGGADGSLEGSVLGLEGDDGEAAETDETAFGGAEGPGGFEGIADGGDLAGAAAARSGRRIPEKRWVCLCVSMWETRRPASCRRRIWAVASAVISSGADAEGEEVADEGGEGRPEGLAVGAEGGDFAGRECGGSVDEQDVAADFEVGVGAGDGDGVVEEGSGGHEGGGGERVGAMEFGDGAIDAGGEAEVVGVDDEGHESRVQGSGYRVQRKASEKRLARNC